MWTECEYLRLKKLCEILRNKLEKKLGGGGGGNQNVISELWKRYIRTLKMLHPNFGNVIFELWKCYIRILKTLYANFETFYPNFENVWTNEQKVDYSVNWKKCKSRALR